MPMRMETEQHTNCADEDGDRTDSTLTVPMRMETEQHTNCADEDGDRQN